MIIEFTLQTKGGEDKLWTEDFEVRMRTMSKNKNMMSEKERSESGSRY